MRCNWLECFAFFLYLIVSRSGASSTSGSHNLFHENDLDSSSNSNESPLPVIPTIDYTYTARSCLYVSPDLPPCRFNRNDNYQRFHRSLDESNEGVKFKRKFPFEELVTVYVIQGCLPSRLPFRMTLCESKDSLERATRIWKLYPFEGTEEEKKNSFVFPRFDLERWTREMKLLEEEERERRKGEKTVVKNDDPKDSFVPSREYFPATISTNLDHEKEEKSTVSNVVRNHSRESRTDETRRRRRKDRRRRRRRIEHPKEREERSSRDRREIREVKEIPYSESISFDPMRLGHDQRSSKFLRANLPFLLSRKSRDIRLGSEFPYLKAIPYDSKKHKFYGIVANDHRLQKLQT